MPLRFKILLCTVVEGSKGLESSWNLELLGITVVIKLRSSKGFGYRFMNVLSLKELCCTSLSTEREARAFYEGPREKK